MSGILFRCFITLFTCFFSFSGFSQNKGELPSQNGVRISYELTKLQSKEKKDQYVIVVTAVNTNDYDLYYPVPMMKQQDGQYKLNSFEKKSFCDVSIENSIGLKSLVDNSANICGEQTALNTRGNEVLFKLSRGQTVTADFKFSVRPGQVPVVTSSFVQSMKKVGEFDVGINGLFVNGTWEIGCGGNRMSLALIKGAQGQIQLQQNWNGHQQLWVMVSENIFEKINDKSASLTYNKVGNVFTYSNNDGVICVWSKK